MPNAYPLVIPPLLLVTSSFLGCAGDQKPVVEAEASNIAIEVDATELTQQSTGTNGKNFQTTPEFHKLAVKHLPNAIQIHDKVISGGQSAGKSAFRELQELGVKTIISVDGAKPDVALAKKYGLRYVHLPHGYNGIPQERVRELAKAVRDLDGPIYIHCHHGRHRSPAAAVVACVSAGLIDPSASLAVLQIAGTSENYRGLFQAAKSARKLDDAILDALNANFSETAKLPPMAEAMVAMERTHDQLKQFSGSGWQLFADHSDVDPAHEALLLTEHFTEMLRIAAVASEPEEFRALLRLSENAGRELEASLRRWQAAGRSQPVPEGIVDSFNRISANCVACHRRFRDMPLASK